MENIIHKNNDILKLCYIQIISLENKLLEAQRNSLKLKHRVNGVIVLY